ncbi:aspartic proteinase 36-like isoform X1 [Capsicum annuum]|uniref:aspartic proteinase 36-like isoform X1 n=1 Tax=Capsicum annuum TaxID=4072 RepID=UPI001FB0CABD|nr:aspartic proteinase 36-like isoform X1 [Capsicum annuum]
MNTLNQKSGFAIVYNGENNGSKEKRAFILLLVLSVHVVGGNLVFNVEHKFGGRGRAVLKELKAHGDHRHGRMLAAADFKLGGYGSPKGLYFTKLSIGTPPKDYHVHVDTGSDHIWVNCAGCNNCSTEATRDGTGAAGNFVTDKINLDQVSADCKTSPHQGNIAFGS